MMNFVKSILWQCDADKIWILFKYDWVRNPDGLRNGFRFTKVEAYTLYQGFISIHLPPYLDRIYFKLALQDFNNFLKLFFQAIVLILLLRTQPKYLT